MTVKDVKIINENNVFELPERKFEEFLKIRDFTVVCLGRSVPYVWEKDGNNLHRRIYIKQLWERASGVWCFDKDGAILWKIPEVVDRNHPNVKGKDFSITFTGTIYVGFSYNEKNDEIIGVTQHGHLVYVKLTTGELVKIVQGK